MKGKRQRKSTILTLDTHNTFVIQTLTLSQLMIFHATAEHAYKSTHVFTHMYTCILALRLHKHHSIFKVLGQSFLPRQRGITSRPHTLNQPLSQPPANGPFVYIQQEITHGTHTEQPWFESVNHLYMLQRVWKSPHLIGTPKKKKEKVSHNQCLCRRSQSKDERLILPECK